MQITIDTTLLFKFTVQKHIYLSLNKVHAGSFRVSLNVQVSVLASSSCVFSIFLRSSIRGVAYVTVFNSSATWVATFRLRGVQVHAGYFRVSKIHRTLTWTTGSLTCVCYYSYASIYTRGLGTPTARQHNISHDISEA